MAPTPLNNNNNAINDTDDINNKNSNVKVPPMRRPLGAPARGRHNVANGFAAALVLCVFLTCGRARVHMHSTRRRTRSCVSNTYCFRIFETGPNRCGHGGHTLNISSFFARNGLPKGPALAKAVSARFHDEMYLVFIRFWGRWHFSFFGLRRPPYVVEA